MRVFIAFVVITALIAAPLSVRAQEPLAPAVETAAFQQLASAIPIGSRIKVRTADGRRLTATLMAADAQRMIVKRRSRVPEPAVSIAYADLSELRRDEGGGMSVGKAVGIGLAAGVGAILTLLAIALAVSD
ncbi:MAG TPA: hypothetical protein VL263_25400 [Vicinamibacterales bacterium]|nr:hypothetical protein [Vicinamibacterales bacterium]